MSSKLRVLLAVLPGSAASLAVAHPGHGAPPSHLHGELIFVGLLLGVIALGAVLQLADRCRSRIGSGRARP